MDQCPYPAQSPPANTALHPISRHHFPHPLRPDPVGGGPMPKDIRYSEWEHRQQQKQQQQYTSEKMDIDQYTPSAHLPASLPPEYERSLPPLSHISTTQDGSQSSQPLFSRRAGLEDMSLEEEKRHRYPSARIQLRHASPLTPPHNRAFPYLPPASVSRDEIDRARGSEHGSEGGRRNPVQRHPEEPMHALSSVVHPTQQRYQALNHADPRHHRRSSPSPINTRDRASPLMSIEFENSTHHRAFGLDRPLHNPTPFPRQYEHSSRSDAGNSHPRDSAPATTTTALDPLQHRDKWDHDHGGDRNYYYADQQRAVHNGDLDHDRPLHNHFHEHSSQHPEQYPQGHHRQHPYRTRHRSGSFEGHTAGESSVDEFAHSSYHNSQARKPSTAPHYHSRSSPRSPTSHHQYQQHRHHQGPQSTIQRPSAVTPVHVPSPQSPSSTKQAKNSERLADGSTTQDSSYDSNIDDDDGSQISHRATNRRNFQYTFGTDMPNTMDLRSAVECCEALCKFALHHSMCPEGYGLAADHGPYLDPNERANLQKIRNMNTTMLIGLQDASKAGEGEGMTARDEAEEAEEDRRRRGRSPLHLSSGPPSNEVVHEFAKAATSIFQLAVRIKAWVGMTPEERQLDEEINMIRGKRCLLMDSTLTVPTVDQHGNVVQKDFVPASSSISKSFHERQRELEQQRQSHISHKDRNQFLNTLSRTKYGPAQYATEDMDRNRDRNSVNKVQDNGDMGDNNNTRQSIRGGGGQGFDSGSDGSLSMRSSHAVPHARSMDHFAYMEPQLRISKHQPLQHNDNDNHGSYMNARHDFNNSRLDIHCINSSNNSRSSKNSDVPHQKYRKRAKRTQPPGRCLSCDSSDTPEWRRGPDGARTLCNACGLHYAKLLKRQGQGQQQQSSAEASTSLGRQSRMEQLQVITFPLRRPIGSNMLPTTAMANGALATAPTNDALSAGRSVDTHSEQALFPSSIEPKREPSDTAQINSAFISGIEDRKTEVKEEP